ncbi:CD36 domain containing protein, partial [Asbolus verrucosus]
KKSDNKCNMTFKKSSLVYACVCIVCLIFMASGIGLAYLGPHLLRCVIDRQLVFAPDSHLYRVWKRVPFSVPLDFYFFNWTNPEDVYDESVKPKFQQMGPYKFLQNQEKIDDRWNDNGTVTYKRRKFWHFRDEQGNGNLQDNITTINPVALSVAHVARTWSYIIRRGLSLTLSSIAATLHMTRTPSQMLFEGYPDTLIKMANTMPFFVGRELPPWDKFGWFYMRNGSADFEGVFNMGTGKNSSLGKIYQWKYWNNTPYYEGDCAKVDGFSGEFFAPNWSDTIRLFSADLCRTITLKYVGKSEVNSIIGNKYTAEDYMLDNGTIYSQNKCFCNGECVPSGVVNVSSCRFGSPTFGSLPHFYNADPYYINQIEGLQPDRKKHEFFVIIEPVTFL